MIIDFLRCRNFRNLTDVEIKPHPKLNVFLGDNAQGKTNLLEAIYMFMAGRSNRSFRDAELIQWHKNNALLQLKLTKHGVNHKLQIKLAEGNKEVKIDSITKRRIADILGYLNVVSFSPDDLSLVKGSPSNRRDFIDLEISQVVPSYYNITNEYKKVVRQRNKLLREQQQARYTGTMLKVWDDKLIELGTKIILKRIETVYKLNILARLCHRQLTGEKETLKLSYDCSLGFVVEAADYRRVKEEDIVKTFTNELKEKKQAEWQRGLTLIGPHRDDILFSIDEHDVRTYGSQGQQRTTVLALKLAELQFMRSETGELPVLLLDDVLSELDEHRQHFLLQLVVQNVQTFITTTEINSFSPEIRENAVVFQVSGGQISRKS